MSNRNNILLRVYVVFGFFALAALAVIGKVFYLQYIEYDYWKERSGKSVRIAYMEGKRGNIFSSDEKLLATSIMYYTVSMDPVAPEEETFNAALRDLSTRLANFRDEKRLPLKSAREYEKELDNARATRDRYVTLFKELSYEEVEEIKTWPLFELGKNKGGLIIERNEKREHIFSKLMERSLGHFTEGKPVVGIEKAFDKYLKGKEMPIRQLKTSKGNWIPLEGIEKYPEDGLDVYSNVNIDFQYIAHNALEEMLEETNAKHGCALVMEVKTGKIKAIVNLGKTPKGTGYSERFNYGVATLSEPGSTIKSSMLMSLLASGKADLETIVNLEGGRKKFYDREMKDDHAPESDDVTLKTAIVKSSNVGVSKLIRNGFQSNPNELIDLLASFGLLQPSGVDLVGEPTPEIIRPGQKEWSGVSLPWLAIGYEIKMTPLQLLTFYNAIANDGKLMKPYIVEKVKKYNETMVAFEPKSFGRICSPKIATDVQEALKGVVLDGTAKASQSDFLPFAGKTGTVNLSPPEMNEKLYQGSFVGFFPADNPYYSCVVVVNDPDPDLGKYYGSQVAAPVFKKIAEGIYARDIESKEPINRMVQKEEGLEENELVGKPSLKVGYLEELQLLCEEFGIPYYNDGNGPWVNPSKMEDNLVLEKIVPFDRKDGDKVPDVINMGLKDALYILENSGLVVTIKGKGKVLKQSLKPGTAFEQQEAIVIHLG